MTTIGLNCFRCLIYSIGLLRILDGLLFRDRACSLVAREECDIIIWIHTTGEAQGGPLVQRGWLYASWLSRLPRNRCAYAHILARL